MALGPVLVLPEIGHVRAVAPDGSDVVFIPSLGAFASLGTPTEIVETAAMLSARDAYWQMSAARCILAACCVDGDPWPLIGWFELSNAGRATDVPGSMPAGEIVAIAQHMVIHGMSGRAKPGGSRGKYAAEFSPAQHIAAAVAHLGVTRDAAAAMTMTEMQLLIEAKFPDAKSKEVPTREEYREQMADRKAKLRARGMNVQ